MLKNAAIYFRNGDFCFTQIDTESDTPISLAQRMFSGGFVVCKDRWWDKARTIVVNLGDVQGIVLEEVES